MNKDIRCSTTELSATKFNVTHVLQKATSLWKFFLHNLLWLLQPKYWIHTFWKWVLFDQVIRLLFTY